MSAVVYVQPAQAGDFFEENRKRLENELIMIAENKETRCSVYLTEEDGLPIFCVYDEVSGDMLCKYFATSYSDCKSTAEECYELHIYGQHMVYSPTEEEMDDLQLKIDMREDELRQAAYEFLDVLLGPNSSHTIDEYGECIDYMVDELVETLAFNYDIDVYRPMFLERKNKEIYYKEYPYRDPVVYTRRGCDYE